MYAAKAPSYTLGYFFWKRIESNYVKNSTAFDRELAFFFEKIYFEKSIAANSWNHAIRGVSCICPIQVGELPLASHWLRKHHNIVVVLSVLHILRV